MTWLLMWLNYSVITMNAMLQLLNIYRYRSVERVELIKPYELHHSCRTNYNFFSFSLSYRELHAIFRSLHYLDGWQWDCQWSIMNLQGVYNGAFPTLVFHGKLGTFPTLSQQTWVSLPTHIPTCLKLLIQESFRVSS